MPIAEHTLATGRKKSKAKAKPKPKPKPKAKKAGTAKKAGLNIGNLFRTVGNVADVVSSVVGEGKKRRSRKKKAGAIAEHVLATGRKSRGKKAGAIAEHVLATGRNKGGSSHLLGMAKAKKEMMAGAKKMCNCGGSVGDILRTVGDVADVAMPLLSGLGKHKPKPKPKAKSQRRRMQGGISQDLFKS